MNSLTKIVKSTFVVEEVKAPPPPIEMDSGNILKRRSMEQGRPVKPRLIPNRDALTDELNRLQVEIKQAKAELRDLGFDLEDARAQAEAAMDVDTAQDEAKNILAQAKAQAEQIASLANLEMEKTLKAAQTQAEGLLEKAKNDGYLEGFSKGFEQSSQEFKDENAPKTVMIAEILDSLTEFHEKTMRENEQELMSLAMEVASKVIGRTLDENPDAVVDILRGIVEENKREEYIKITLSPDLAQIKAKASKDVRAMLEKLGANISVGTDIDADPGSIMVETPKGIVDVSVQTQLDNLDAAIREG